MRRLAQRARIPARGKGPVERRQGSGHARAAPMAAPMFALCRAVLAPLTMMFTAWMMPEGMLEGEPSGASE